MSISLLTNYSATLAMNNVSSASKNLQNSLNRLSSGSKINSPSDDAGGLAVSMKMGAAIKRQAIASDNISNAMSFLQTQDGAMESAYEILSRIGELKTLSQDVTKNDQDKESYNTEFIALRDQLVALTDEKFNGIDLFGSSSLSVKTSVDGTGSPMTMSGVDILGADSAPFETVTDSFDNLDNFSDESLSTATATVFGGELNLGTDQNDLAQVDTNTSVSGAWEMSFDFNKSTVVNDDLTVSLGGSEVYRYDATDFGSHSVRIVFDGVNTAEAYLDGAGSPTETNSVGSNSGNVRLQLSSTVPGASANIDNFSLASTVTSNETGSIATASSLDSLDISTLKSAVEEVASFRAQNGSHQSRLSFAQEMLIVNKTNLEAANSRIKDVDVATESTQLARFNILQQAGMSMLSQANQSSQIALKLIG